MTVAARGDSHRARDAGRPRRRIPSLRESPRHRPRDGCVRVRDRPRKRRAPPGGGLRPLADVRARAAGREAARDLRGRPESHCGARAGRRRARGVLRGCRRPHRALRRAGARRRSRRGRVRRGRLRRVRAGAGQAVGVRLRAGREGADAADGEARSSRSTPSPSPSHAADALAVAICHALAPPLLEERRMISRLRGTPVGRTPDGLVLDVGGVGYLVAATPSALRRADGAQRGDARDLPPRPRGRAPALRLRRACRARALHRTCSA